MKHRVLCSAVLGLVVIAAGAAQADNAVSVDQLRQTCAADFQKYCPDAEPGAIRACIRGHFMKFTKPCRHALLSFRHHQQPQGGAPAATP